jgi:protein-tyrosine phosphatase
MQHFMLSDIFWIELDGPGRLAIMARPRAGDWLSDEIKNWRDNRIDVVVSLMESTEVEELGLRGEREQCERLGIEFISFPIADRGIPHMDGAAALARSICTRLSDGKSVTIHCRAGIGRSAVLAGCVLIHAGTHDADRAFDAIGKARGLKVPDTDAQRLWLIDFQKSMRGV